MRHSDLTWGAGTLPKRLALLWVSDVPSPELVRVHMHGFISTQSLMLDSAKRFPSTHLPLRHIYSRKATGLGRLDAKESSCSGQLQDCG